MGMLLVVLVLLITFPAVGLANAAGAPGAHTPITITITSGRMEQILESQTGAVSVLEPSAGERPGPASGLGELLDPVPGLFSASRFNGAQDLRLSVRGFGARGNFGIRGIRILLDGFPLTLPDGQSALDDLDPALIARAEVRRGPAGSMYGSSAGGVISLESPDLFTRTGLYAGTSTGSHGTHEGRLRYGTIYDDQALGAQLSLRHSDGYRDHSRQEHRLLTLQYQGKAEDGGSLSAFLTGVDSPFALDPGGLTEEESRRDRRAASPLNRAFDAGEKVRQLRAGIALTRPAGSGEIRLRGQALGRDFENKLPFSATDLDRGVGTVSLEFEQQGDRGNAFWRWVAGVDLALQRDRRTRFLNDLGSVGARTADQRETVKTAGGFLNLIVEPVPDLTLQAGVRADWLEYELDDQFLDDGNDSGQRTFAELSPGGGASLRLREGLNLFGRVSTAFEPPTTTELADPSGGGGFNKSVDPQDALGLEVGVRWRLAEGGQGELAGFYTRVRDQLVQTPIEGQPGRFYYVNAASSRYRGVELSVDQPLGDDLKTALSFSWGDYRFDDFTDADGNRFDDNTIPGIPRYQIFASLDHQPSNNLGTTLSARWTGKRYVDNANSAKADSYVIVGIHCSYRLKTAGSQVSIYGGIDNLFDEEYEDNLRINAASRRFFEPAPARSVYLGISTSF
ncbi:MAG: TonB-dependent receptor [Thiohalobacterales bacterium]|nr:TonB-dependent receptor [Thiohalobacterales bacterium]